MNRRIFAFAAALLFCLSLVGCERKREFIKDENFSQGSLPTQAASAGEGETTTQPEGTFTFARGIQMGMTIAEVQAAVGQVLEIGTVEDPLRRSISVDFSGVFIHYFTTKSVIFLFDPDNDKLIQLQFRCTTDADGAAPIDTFKLFDQRYGKQAVYQGRYPNHIWLSDDVYILVSEMSSNQYAITYTEKSWFEQYYKEEVRAYNRA